MFVVQFDVWADCVSLNLKQHMNQVQRLILIFTIVLISFLYFLSSAYINCSNDGSHYALVSAMVNDRSTEVSNYINYTAKIDYAVKDGKYYSDRLPGNAVLMIPFYIYGKGLEAMGFHSAIDWRPIEEVAVVLEANICGAIGVLFLFLIFLHFKFSFNVSLLSSVLYGITTLNWQESTHVFSHAVSMCFVIISIYCFLKTARISDRIFLIGLFFLSYAVTIELQNMLYFLPVVVYLLMAKSIQTDKQTLRYSLVFKIVMVTLSGFILLLAYNYFTFHEWMLKSNKYNPMFPEEGSFLSSLSGKPIKALDILFTNIKNRKVYTDWSTATQNETPGLFVVSPLLLLAIPGYVLFYRKYKREAVLFLAIIGINVLIAAFHKTVLVRHIFTITPLIYFPIIFVLQYCIEHTMHWKKVALCTAISILAVLSIVRVFYIIHTYYGRQLNDVFPFRREVLAYIMFLLLISVFYGFMLFMKRIKQKLF